MRNILILKFEVRSEIGIITLKNIAITYVSERLDHSFNDIEGIIGDT
jgi:hypothetical protein